MWKDYSWNYIKNNRTSGVSIIVAAFFSALFLSVLSSIFYNLWVYEVKRTEYEEGDWQSRITGELDEADLALIEGFANVEKVIVLRELSDGANITADIYFENKRSIFSDMPKIVKRCGLNEEAVTYHYSLLNLYLIRDKGDTALRWIFPFLFFVTVLTCLALIMVIHNSFAVSMETRIHQFGIFSSIGATPGQIRTCLLQEAAVLCALPMAAGLFLGIFVSMLMVKGSNILLGDVLDRLEAVFSYHPVIFLITVLITGATVLISAWMPARKISRYTPLEAIKNTGELQLKRKKNSPVLSFLFGIEGELAGNALNAQKKAMRTSSISLTFSFLAFSLMMCFITIAAVSQRETYFEKYQDMWDIMATVKNTDIDAFGQTARLRQLPGIKSAAVYQKAWAKRLITKDELSEEFIAMGGFSTAKDYVSAKDGGWLVNVPVIIMDDSSFLEYCRQAGAPERLDGAVILNRIQDTANPNFRNRSYVPYVRTGRKTTVLRQAGREEITAEIPVVFYTKEKPVLREEFAELDYYELVHFLPVSVWKEIKGKIQGAGEDTLIRVLAKDNATLNELNGLASDMAGIFGKEYEVEIENRIQEKDANDAMFGGMMFVFGFFCTLIAMIGIGSVFSNTLGFVRQRRREFARYMSIGMTREGMKKMFCIEALVIAGRPLFLTLPVTIAVCSLVIKAAYLDPVCFLKEAPFLPIAVFFLSVFVFVAFAYVLGAGKVLRGGMMDVLLDDTMMY